MEYKNIDNFKKWCNEIYAKPYDFKAVLADVERHYYINGGVERWEGLNAYGSFDYEEKGSFTKSGKPELYQISFESICVDIEAGDYETTLIF